MSLMPLTQDRRAIAVGTPLGEDKLVATRMRVTEQLGRPFEIELTVRSQDPYVDPQKIIGQNVTIRLALDDQASDFRYFNGFVARFRTVEEDPRLPRYEMTVVPFLWFLSRTTDCRAWQDVAVPDIVTSLIKERGFTDITQDLTFTGYAKREFCVQYRETVLDYVSRLMEEEGIYYVFNHEDGKHTMVLVDGPEAHANVGTLNYRKSGGAVGRKDFDLVTDWAMEYEAQTGGYTLLDYDFKKPKNKLQGSTEAAKQHDQATHERLDYPGGFVASDEGDRLSRVRLEELQAGFEIARGQTTARNLAAGSIFTLAKHPLAANNKDWLVTSLDIQVDIPETFTATAAGAGMSFDCHFTAIPSQTPFRPARVTPVPIISGPQPAIVVGPSGEEIHTDEFGRVRVRFYWDVRSDNNEKSSCWLRVAQPAAGKKWGGLFLPRVGMEVIVEFVDGDPDHPLVTGCVYNGANSPPYALPQFKTISTIKSSSSKGGDGFNEIRLEDKKGEEQIFIHGQKRMDVRVRGNLYETNYGNREVRVGWESDDGESGGSFNILVRKDFNRHVKGSHYESIETDQNLTVKRDVVQDLQGNLTTKVGKAFTLNGQTIIVQGSDTISQNGNTLCFQGSSAINIKGGNINLEGTIGISLKAGGNFVVIDQTGVSINGTLVMINSGGAATAAQSAKEAQPVQMKEPLDALAAADGDSGTVQAGYVGKVHHAVRSQALKSLKMLAPPPLASSPKASPAGRAAPPPSQMPPSKEVKCAIVSIQAQCQHQAAGARIAKAGGFLDVVPTKSAGFDTIKLHVDVQANCGDHPEWSITGRSSRRGADQTFDANAPVTSSLWLIDLNPNTYHVGCATCAGTQYLEVNAYSSDVLSFELTSEHVKEKWKWLGDACDKVKEWLHIKNDKFGVQLFVGKLSAKAGWKEHTDVRAFYYYIITGSFDPLIGGEFKVAAEGVPFIQGVRRIPAFGDYIGQVVDWILHAEAYFKISGGIGIDVSWERKAPDDPRFAVSKGAGITGKLTVAAGLDGDAVGKELFSVEVEANGEFTVVGKPFIDSEGFGMDDFEVNFEGLKGIFHAKFCWGAIHVDKANMLIDPRPMVERMKWFFHQSGESR